MRDIVEALLFRSIRHLFVKLGADWFIECMRAYIRVWCFWLHIYRLLGRRILKSPQGRGEFYWMSSSFLKCDDWPQEITLCLFLVISLQLGHHNRIIASYVLFKHQNLFPFNHFLCIYPYYYHKIDIFIYFFSISFNIKIWPLIRLWFYYEP